MRRRSRPRGRRPAGTTTETVGTITDNNTKLTWEKQSADGSLHDKDNLYTWNEAFEVHVATLNATNFAGHSDWRVPNVKKLQSIVNYEKAIPSMSPEFNNACAPGCTVLTCSCTTAPPAAPLYWSSSTIADIPMLAWLVSFFDGNVNGAFKSSALRVRAVRSGSNLGSSQ